MRNFQDCFSRFCRDEDGVASLEFVIVFPIFFGFFLMTFESGLFSLRHVMLERGVDIAVRDIRIGQMPDPTPETLRARICSVAQIISDCEENLQIELILRDPRAWVAIDPTIRCIDRGANVQPVVTFTNGDNNDLIILRACLRIDPFLPTTGLGKAVVESNNNSAAQGSLAIVSQSAFVIEPFRLEE